MKFDLSKDIDIKKADAYFDKLKRDGARIDLKKVLNRRTINQNSYLHVCLGYFCLHTGYSIDESKELFAGILPEMMRYSKNGHTFRRSTSDLDTKEMTILIDTIRNVCAEELGVYVPDSEEYLIHRFDIEKELNHYD